jgi:hypothetical protein
MDILFHPGREPSLAIARVRSRHLFDLSPDRLVECRHRLLSFDQPRLHRFAMLYLRSHTTGRPLKVEVVVDPSKVPLASRVAPMVPAVTQATRG